MHDSNLSDFIRVYQMCWILKRRDGSLWEESSRMGWLQATPRLRVALALLVSLVGATSAVGIKPTADSLCGEQVAHSTGFINGLYYIVYESTATAPPPQSIPVVLWLSGGPGCSGLVAALFENGPCIFDDEANEMRRNTNSWTNAAHVIYVDQPHGTGFSDAFDDLSDRRTWTESRAMTDLAAFVEAFFAQHAQFVNNDVFIFGESFGGHYAPDVAARLITTNPTVWKHKLKGVGIGNGVVSPIAGVQSYFNFAVDNKYAHDLPTASNKELAATQLRAIQLMQQCASAQAQVKRPHRMRARALEEDEDPIPRVCHEAAEVAGAFEQSVISQVVAAGHNMYDLRRPCRTSDSLNLCYRFTRLQEFVNQQEALAYFGVKDQAWRMCSDHVILSIRDVDYWGDSKANVVQLLENGVRVLVYAGDADTMATWNMQDRWTHDLEWSGAGEYASVEPVPWTVDGAIAGTVTSTHGLSLVRVYDAGHMVPHDQPKAALHLLKDFIALRGSFT